MAQSRKAENEEKRRHWKEHIETFARLQLISHNAPV